MGWPGSGKNCGNHIKLPKQGNQKEMLLKRMMDIFMSGTALIVLVPVFLIIACLVKLTSGSPVFFRQIRIGRNQKEFHIIKFRTMTINAHVEGLCFTTKNDARITRFGKFLRKTKLDELPELWNVFVGDMSLVGPRPMVLKHVRCYKPEWKMIFNVRPGITDLATIMYRDEEYLLENHIDIEQYYNNVLLPNKVKLSLEYIKRRSLLLDFIILFKTIWLISLGLLFVKQRSSMTSKAKSNGILD